MICPKCGTELPEGSKFCDVCGASMAAAAPAPAAMQPEVQPVQQTPPPPIAQQVQQTPPQPIQQPQQYVQQPQAQQYAQQPQYQQPQYQQPQPQQYQQPYPQQPVKKGLPTWAKVLIGVGLGLILLITIPTVIIIKMFSDSESGSSKPAVAENQIQQDNAGAPNQVQQNGTGNAQAYNSEDDFFAGGVDQSKIDAVTSQNNDQSSNAGSNGGDIASGFQKTFTVDDKYGVKLTITGEPGSYIKYSYEGDDYGHYFYYEDHNATLAFPNGKTSEQLLTEEYQKGEEMTIGDLTGWFYFEDNAYCFIAPYSAYYNGGTGMMAAYFYGEDENTVRSFISNTKIEPVLE